MRHVLALLLLAAPVAAQEPVLIRWPAGLSLFVAAPVGPPRDVTDLIGYNPSTGETFVALIDSDERRVRDTRTGLFGHCLQRVMLPAGALTFEFLGVRQRTPDWHSRDVTVWLYHPVGIATTVTVAAPSHCEVLNTTESQEGR